MQSLQHGLWLFMALLTLLHCGCNSTSNASGGGAAPEKGISPQQLADAVHAVMMADRTVYAKEVVTRLKKQKSPVTPDEYWEDQTDGHAIPLPAQMFRMGAERVSKDPSAGFTYSLKSLWPLNSQHKPKSEDEVNALNTLKDKPGENVYQEETFGDKKYFTAYYPDKAVAEACWTCHNDHPNRGENYPDFAEGDVMGAVAVRIPLD